MPDTGFRGIGRFIASAWLTLAAMAFAPPAASAETASFFDTTVLFPSGGAGTSGPANEYPSTISVAGVEGTVTDVNATVFGFASSSPDDADVVLVGPSGTAVMLLSDACGENPQSIDSATWTFDDSAPTFISDNGPCQGFVGESFKPSNYGNPDEDDHSASGGPPPPYTNSLANLASGPANGQWRLFVFDDNAAGFVGFTVVGWGLTFETAAAPPADTSPPETEITDGPAKRTKKRKASFAFASSEPGSSFECRVDDEPFAPCTSPFEGRVTRAKHAFEVRAIDAAGNADASPARYRWKVKRKR